MIVKCTYCNKTYKIKPVHARMYREHFCSKEHNILWMKANAFHKNCMICGKTFYCQPSQIKLRNRKTCSVGCRGKLQSIKAGENRIKNGFTKHQIDRCIRHSKETEEWRKAVFARDDYTCQMCFIKGGCLEADHIKPFAYFPELRFVLKNGRTLCRQCHDTTKMSAKAMRITYADQISRTSQVSKDLIDYYTRKLDALPMSPV